jgi:hypothetical protein
MIFGNVFIVINILVLFPGSKQSTLKALAENFYYKVRQPFPLVFSWCN